MRSDAQNTRSTHGSTTAWEYLALGIVLKLSRWAEVGFLARLTHAAACDAKSESISGVDDPPSRRGSLKLTCIVRPALA